MLEKKYSFKEIESKYNLLWEKNKTYKWNSKDKNVFTIDTPPPTISGKLHIGHIFSYCNTDFIARFQRMIGKNVFYPIGFDNNGLPTERLVEKIYKIRAKNFNKEKFTKICFKVIEESKKEFKDLFKSVGISYDWSLEYQTISRNSLILSQMSFIDLYNKGYAYRKIQPIFWDSVDKTAISQAELEEKLFKSSLNTIIFLTEEGEKILITTTRPEMILACVAIFYNPEDIRYTHLYGKMAIVPITNEKVPIIADNKVKLSKDSGLVMCSTFCNELDIYWQQKYNLPMKIIIDKDGKIIFRNLNEIYIEINRLKIKEAREKMIRILVEKGFLIKKIIISHFVKCAERSGIPIEILPTYQWFIKTLEEKSKILDKVKKCIWYPITMRKRMELWIEGLNSDWCISRQRYFGIPFPVWYSKRKGEEGKIIIAELKNLPIDPLKNLPNGYSRDEVIPDQDVMDTWATSSITPQINALAINSELYLQKNRYSKIFPADLRSQSHEIIRTWAFYTILKAHYHSSSLPWNNIMISGWCLTNDKKKMSKSKDNIVDPGLILEMYGADVIRYWIANSKLGIDTVYSEKIFKIGKRFIIKFWNASRFISIFIEKHKTINIEFISETMDKWILSKLYKLIDKVTNEMLNFKYKEAFCSIEKFFWKDFCDNYLELVKKRLYNVLDNKAKFLSAKYSLSYSLNIILRLFAPFIPYLTEEIYYQLYNYNSLHTKNNWPIKENFMYDKFSEEIGDNFIQILDLIRKIKSDNNLSVKHLIKKLIIKANAKENKLNQSAQDDLQNICNIDIIFWSNDVKGFTTKNGKFTINFEL